MTEAWYDIVLADERLTQGDLIPNCPVVGWKAIATQISDPSELSGLAQGRQEDVVVLTQACDLEHDKVENVLLCPHIALTEFRQAWENDTRAKQQNPTERGWQRLCDNIADGYVWEHAMLDRHDGSRVAMDCRVVYFHDVYTVPRITLESILKNRGSERLRLRAPYREHLSQAFARFFMRVGLPLAIKKTWNHMIK